MSIFDPLSMFHWLRTARLPFTAGLLAVGLVVGIGRHFGAAELHHADSPRNFPLALAPATPDDWPELRGPVGNGSCYRDGFPTGVGRSSQPAWQAALPGLPGGGVCLRGGLVIVPVVETDRNTISLWALDRDRGSPLWKTVLHRSLQMNPASRRETAMPACDGQSAFVGAAVDGRLIVSAVDLQGRREWQCDVGPMAGENGRIVSPMLHESLVIVAADPPQEYWRRRLTPGYLAAIHRQSGEIIWRVPRWRADHLTPLILARFHGRSHLISPAAREICAYDPASGALLWSYPWEATGIADVAAWDDRRVFLSVREPRPIVVAIEIGNDDQPSPSIVWQCDAGGSPIVALQSAESSVVALQEDGELASFDAVTGKLQWRRRLPGSYIVAPIIAGPQMLCINSDGLAVTVDLRQRGKTITEEPLCDGVIGPAAATRKQFLLRTEAGLICFPWSDPDSPLAITPGKPRTRL